MLTVDRIHRLEIWSGWECAGGERIAVITDPTVLTSTETVAGGDVLNLTLPVRSAGEIAEGRVLRIDGGNGEFDEWKVTRITQASESGYQNVDALPVALTDVAGAGLLEQTLGDGARIHDLEGVGLTVTQHFNNFILPVLVAAGLTWISLGTVSPTVPVDLAYSWEGPLSAIQRLAAAANSEFQIRRNGTSGYLVDFVSEVGQSSPTADIRSEKNLPGLEIERDAMHQVTRVYPKGASNGEESGTMARAVWQVSNVAGSVVTLEDPAGGDGPIVFDDQLEGHFLRRSDGTLTEVTDSNALAQTVTVADATGIGDGDLIQFRADTEGSDLTWLDIPGTSVKAGVLDQTDVPAVNNVIPNSAARQWSGISSVPPDGWSVVGSAVVTKQTAAPYVRTGGNSIKVETTEAATGVLSPAGPVFPSAEAPHGSGYASIWVVSGSVRVELVLTTPGGTVVRPIAPSVASNSVSGQWAELGVSGEDLHALGVTQVAIRVVQNGETAAVFYVDAAQFSETASHEPFVEGSGGTKLWQAANEKLRVSGGPLVSYQATLVDLARVDPATWGDDSKLYLGANARIKDPRLDVAVTTRILEIFRDYLTPGTTRISLSNKPDDITGSFARPKRVPRPVPTGGSIDPGALGDTEVLLEELYTNEIERAYRVYLGAAVDSAWLGTVEFDTPSTSDPWSSVADATQPLTGNTFVIPRPSARKALYGQVEGRLADLTPVSVVRFVLEGAAPQAAIWDVDSIEEDSRGIQWFQVQSRGEPITAVSVTHRVGLGPWGAFRAPDRKVGDYSKVKGRVLASGEYEFEVPKDQNRTVGAMARATYASSYVEAYEFAGFDWDTRPEIRLCFSIGKVAVVSGDGDCRSIRLQHSSGWESWSDGPGVDVKVPVPDDTTWQLDVTAYSKPKDAADIADARVATKKLSVRGDSSTSPPPTAGDPFYTQFAPSAPAVGGKTVGLSLKASAATGTGSVRARLKDRGEWTDLGAISLSPSLSTPPTTVTGYTYSGLAADYVRVADNAVGSRQVTLELTAAIDVSGIEVETQAKSIDWYVGSEDVPPPPDDPSWVPPYPILAKPLAGTKSPVLTLKAQNISGHTTRVTAFSKLDGTTSDYGDITAALSPSPGAPPTTATDYVWDGLGSGFVRVADGTADAKRAIISVTVEILDSGSPVAAITRTEEWYVAGGGVTPGGEDPTTPAAPDWLVVSVAPPASVGSRTAVISLRATRAAGNVRLTARLNDSNSGIVSLGDITAAVMGSSLTPPTTLTEFDYVIPDIKYAKVSGVGGLVSLEVTAEILYLGAVVAKRTWVASQSWKFDDGIDRF